LRHTLRERKRVKIVAQLGIGCTLHHLHSLALVWQLTIWEAVSSPATRNPDQNRHDGRNGPELDLKWPRWQTSLVVAVTAVAVLIAIIGRSVEASGGIGSTRPVAITATAWEVTTRSVAVAATAWEITTRPVAITATVWEVTTRSVAVAATAWEVTTWPVAITATAWEVTTWPVAIAATAWEVTTWPVAIAATAWEVTTRPIAILGAIISVRGSGDDSKIIPIAVHTLAATEIAIEAGRGRTVAERRA